MIPVELPGVIGVTANGANTQTDGDDDPNDYLKSFYSSFGISEADVVAPGGDWRFGITRGRRPERARPLDVAGVAAVHLSGGARRRRDGARCTATSRGRRWPGLTWPASRR